MDELEEAIRSLSPDDQRQVMDFIKRLTGTSKSLRNRKLKQTWAGALRRYRHQYTSLELQRKAFEWRGD
jgi:Protein of unknown function (DUF2281)